MFRQPERSEQNSGGLLCAQNKGAEGVALQFLLEIVSLRYVDAISMFYLKFFSNFVG